MHKTRVFEIIRNGQRRGLELTEDDARKSVGTEALHLYEFRAVDLPVVFILIDRPSDPDGAPMIDEVYSTIEMARAARDAVQASRVDVAFFSEKDVAIEIAELK